jgi:hypothetical protein
VYSLSRFDFLANIDGLYIGDRTAGTASAGRRWVPSAHNMRYLPRAENITVTGTDLWGLYTGGWGDPNLQLESGTKLTCLSGWSNVSRAFTQQGATALPLLLSKCDLSMSPTSYHCLFRCDTNG